MREMIRDHSNLQNTYLQQVVSIVVLLRGNEDETLCQFRMKLGFLLGINWKRVAD
jgi:hypothetical protein